MQKINSSPLYFLIMSEEPIIIDQQTKESDTVQQVKNKTVVVAKEILPPTLILVPLLERPLFPKTMAPVIITEEALKATILKEANENNLKHLGLILIRSEQEGITADYPESGEDFYQVGISAKIMRMSPPKPGEPLQILVQVIDRFNLKEVITGGPVFRGKVSHWDEPEFDNNEELKAYSVSIIDAIRELVASNPLFKEGLSFLLERMNVNDPATLADLSASMTTSTGEELQRILEIENIRERIEQALILIKREVEISKIKAQISQRIENRVSKQQREFFLKQQLSEIKKELGLQKEGSETEAEKYQQRLKELHLSDEAQQRIDDELEKLQVLEPSSPEFNVTRNYLDWLTTLPWGKYTEDNYDIQKASQVLDDDHYGLEDVKQRILELISVGIIKGDLAGSIILLVGPPGVGKTSIGHSIARALGREFYRFSVGGMRDEAEIKGHRRTYIGALPGKFIQAMKTSGTANPVIMIDEIDKIGASFRGDPASALLEVLDPEQNKEFLDHYLDVRFDLSKALFVATANQLDTIPAPLLDRMEIIRLSGYVLEEKQEIARNYLLPKQLKEHGLNPEHVSISDDILREVIDGYAREAGVRNLENNLKKILRKSVMKIVQDEVENVEIDADILPKWLGRRVFAQEQAFEKPRIGVIQGLAYTSLGGATLHIESIPVPAKGPGFKQTGQLGQVMVESSEIAYTYIRSILKDNEAATEFINTHLIHLHVPAGATPKDGPSAGITMASAIYSLATQKAPIDKVAMT
ncbi:MAG: endopeptidase La, partial [Chloroflexota bacterium]